MRILTLNHNVAWSGGTFYRAYHFAREMARRGHQVTLLTIAPRERIAFRRDLSDGVQIVQTPDLLWGRGRTGWDLWDTLQRIRIVRGQEWDLVHAFDARPAVILPALVAQRKGAPLVLDWADWWGRGGTITERATGPLVRWLAGPLETYFEEAFRTRADGTTVISSALRDRAIALGVRPETILQIPQGSDVERIQPLNRDDCRRALGLPERPLLLGYLGVLTRSDARLLFDAFAQVLRWRPECRLVLIGSHRVSLPRLAGILETGRVSHEQLVQYLGACDLLVLPLKDTIASRGRWPSKLNDYLAAGRPVVSSAVGDVRDLFARHSIGLAVQDSPEAMAEAIDTLLANGDLRAAMGEEARRVAESEFAWSLLGARLEDYYLMTLRHLGVRA